MTTTLADVLTDALMALVEMPQTTAAELVCAMLKTAAERGHGGAEYYLSRAAALSRDERNRQIRIRFNGQNLKQVCQEFQVSRRTVYRALHDL